MNRKYMQNGRSMIEMLGVLAIIGILTVGGFNLVMKAQTHQRLNEVIDNMTTLASKVRVVARDYTGNVGSLNSYVNTGRAFPDSLEYGDGGFTDRNNITYDVYYAGEGGQVLFAIKVSGLTTEMCMNMVNANYGNSSTSGFVGLSIGGDFSSASYVSPQSIELNTAAEKCIDGVSLLFAFR